MEFGIDEGELKNFKLFDLMTSDWKILDDGKSTFGSILIILKRIKTATKPSFEKISMQICLPFLKM